MGANTVVSNLHNYKIVARDNKSVIKELDSYTWEHPKELWEDNGLAYGLDSFTPSEYSYIELPKDSEDGSA
ncbi:MAG: hypothetical protein COA36_16705 [Desulfotalea sp.]|nr:MAG: hypothetical protein COA36_16705 [Desulfotalea sp.]